MGNQKIWEPIVVVGGAVIGFSAIIYALFIYNKDGKDLFEVTEDKVGKTYNKLTAATQAATNMTGGSATKRHKKQSKGKGKSHKKH